MAPAASAQNMNASSGSGLCPRRMSMRAGSYLHWPRVGAAERLDPALPARDLQAELGRGRGDGDRARATLERLRSVRKRDGQEAHGAVARAARTVPRRRADACGRTRRARGDRPPPPARAMVKKLAALSLARHERYRGVELTPAGERVALEVIRHHRLLELYLAETLGLDVDDVHDEADRLEHALSEELEQRIDKALGYPTHDPHGDPIPDSNLKWPSNDDRKTRARPASETRQG